MNPLERTLARLAGKPVDRIPNFDILMGFAARHSGARLSDYFLDYRVLCAATLAMVESFGVDIVSTISDSYREPADLGAQIEFPEDNLPLCRRPLLANATDLSKLKPLSSPGKRMGDSVEGVRLLHERVGGQIPVMGWVEGALAQAVVLRGDSELMLDIYDCPEFVSELLEFCCELEIAFARWQIAAGADIIGLGDAIASQVSPHMYRELALPYEQRIFQAVHQMGALARLHICGNTTRILEEMPLSGADIIDIDWMVDIRQAAQAFGDGPALVGNFDPVAVMLNGTVRQVEAAVRYCAENGGSKYFSAAGCEIPEGTPYENTLAQRRVLSEIGSGKK
jgi:MtaA/CmuA family methyltransferase